MANSKDEIVQSTAEVDIYFKCKDNFEGINTVREVIKKENVYLMIRAS